MFLRFSKENGFIDYDDEFIERITVHSEEIMERYNTMMDLCRKCISQCDEVVFSGKKFEIPKQLLK